MKPFTQWLQIATDEQQQALANAARTSVAYLHQIAGGYRKASAATAGRIEDAIRDMRSNSVTLFIALPKVTRADLCDACVECPYLAPCKSSKEKK